MGVMSNRSGAAGGMRRRAGLGPPALTVLVAIWTGAAIDVRADTIRLKSGEQIEGSIIESDIAACPQQTELLLDLFAWSACNEGTPCAERYDVHFQSLGPATVASGMNIAYVVHATASGYDEEEPPPGAELTVVIE